jgi:MFS family permease
MVVWFLTPFAFAGYSTVLPLHAASRFAWTQKDLGWLFVIVGVTAALVQGWLFGRLARRTGDRWLLVVGALAMAVGIGIVPYLGSSASLYGWTVLLALGNSLAMPAMAGMVSVLAAANEQGAVLGAAQALSALGRLSGPEVFGVAYDRGGALLAFLAAGAAMLLAMGMASRVPGEAGSVKRQA